MSSPPPTTTPPTANAPTDAGSGSSGDPYKWLDDYLANLPQEQFTETVPSEGGSKFEKLLRTCPDLEKTKTQDGKHMVISGDMSVFNRCLNQAVESEQIPTETDPDDQSNK